MMSTTMLVTDERSDRPTFSVRWLAGTTSVTSLEGDDVTLSCIFSGRCVTCLAEVAERDSLRNCIARVNCWYYISFVWSCKISTCQDTRIETLYVIRHTVPIRGGDGNGSQDNVAGIAWGRGQYNGGMGCMGRYGVLMGNIVRMGWERGQNNSVLFVTDVKKRFNGFYSRNVFVFLTFFYFY